MVSLVVLTFSNHKNNNNNKSLTILLHLIMNVILIIYHWWFPRVCPHLVQVRAQSGVPALANTVPPQHLHPGILHLPKALFPEESASKNPLSKFIKVRNEKLDISINN